jgi:hypothetical protein
MTMDRIRSSRESYSDKEARIQTIGHRNMRVEWVEAPERASLLDLYLGEIHDP